MKLICHHCEEEVDIIVELKEPHLKAKCSICNKYIKFLNKEERIQLEKEEINNATRHQN